MPQPTILHASATQHYWQGIGSLSVKMFVRGRAMYASQQARFAVDQTCLLLLNHDQPYTIEVESYEPVESFCVFFPHGFVENIARTNDADLLDQPSISNTTPFSVVDRTYPKVGELALAMQHLYHAYTATVQLDLTEQFHAVARQLICSQNTVIYEIAMLREMRPSLRAEMYRRLHHARDFIHACYAQPITLDQIANVAMVSPNHLLRRFKQAFGTTPHQYLTAVRLDHAKMLLRESDMSISEICLAVGFESFSSFSWLFQQRVGISPQAFRARR